MKNKRENRDKVIAPKFSEALELFKTELTNDSTMKPRSKGYRLDCITKLQRTWPELWELHLNEISAAACKEWAAIRGFFSLPLPRTDWEKTKASRNHGFVRFVNNSLKAHTRSIQGNVSQ